MHFRRAVQRYGRTAQPVTPYQRAAQVWDERIGSARVQARNWRLAALGSLVLSGGLAAGLVWQSLQSRVVPYVVAVDRLGQAQAIAPADRRYRPTDPQIAWHLAHFIANVRTISLDPVLMREAWLAAYDFTTPRGARFLSDYARSVDPFAKVGTRTVSVQVTSVVRASDSAFQVKWTESEFERGTMTGRSHWTAILSIVVKPPTSADALRRNPLGLLVDAIDWAKEIEPAPGGSFAPPDGRPASSGAATPDSPPPDPAPEPGTSERTR